MARASSASCTFLTGGDVAPDREKGKGLFGRLAPLFRDAGYSFLNLEHTLSRSGRLVAGKGDSSGGISVPSLGIVSESGSQI